MPGELSRERFEQYCNEVDVAVKSCVTPEQRNKIEALAKVMLDEKLSIAERRQARLKLSQVVDGLFQRSVNLQSEAVDRYCEDVLGIAPSVFDAQIPQEQIMEQVGYLAKDLVETGNYSEFSYRLTSWVSKESESAANAAMTKNAERHAARTGKEIKFAFVPQSLPACILCIRAASVGFGFVSTEFEKIHDHCKCKKVPNTAGENLAGHNPKAYYDTWKEMEKINQDDSFSDAQKRLLFAAVQDVKIVGKSSTKGWNTRLVEAFEDGMSHTKKTFLKNRDSKDHYDRTVDSLLRKVGDIYGIEMSGRFAPEKHIKSGLPNGEELWAATRRNLGFKRVEFLPEDNSELNPDLLTDRGIVDIKTIRSIRQANKRLKHAYEQCTEHNGGNPGKCIVSKLKYRDSGDQLNERIKSFVEDGLLDEVWVLESDGAVEKRT